MVGAGGGEAYSGGAAREKICLDPLFSLSGSPVQPEVFNVVCSLEKERKLLGFWGLVEGALGSLGSRRGRVVHQSGHLVGWMGKEPLAIAGDRGTMGRDWGCP